MPPEQDRRIRNALIELCFECGFARVTAEDLCGRAGVDLLTFELQYSDLEDCFMQVYLAELEAFRRRISRVRDTDGPWRDRVRATGYELLRFLAEDEKVAHFVVVEVRSAGEPVQRVIEAEVEAMVDLIDEGRACLDDPDSLSRVTAEQVSGSYFIQLYALVGNGPLPPEEEIIPQMMYTAVLPYLGPQAALEELSTPPPPSPSG
jgi:AcrR family transcriptional regulator